MFGTRKALKYYSKTTSFGLWHLSAFGAKYPKRCPDRLTCWCCLWGFLCKNWSFLEQFPKHRAIHYFATIFDWLNQMTSGFLCCLKWRFLYCNKYMVPNGFWRQLDGTLGFTKYLACFTKEYFQIFSKKWSEGKRTCVWGVPCICCNRETAIWDSGENQRSFGSFNQKWLQNNV